jgi:hypothetical protein
LVLSEIVENFLLNNVTEALEGKSLEHDGFVNAPSLSSLARQILQELVKMAPGYQFRQLLAAKVPLLELKETSPAYEGVLRVLVGNSTSAETVKLVLSFLCPSKCLPGLAV